MVQPVNNVLWTEFLMLVVAVRYLHDSVVDCDDVILLYLYIAVVRKMS